MIIRSDIPFNLAVLGPDTVLYDESEIRQYLQDHCSDMDIVGDKAKKFISHGMGLWLEARDSGELASLRVEVDKRDREARHLAPSSTSPRKDLQKLEKLARAALSNRHNVMSHTDDVTGVKIGDLMVAVHHTKDRLQMGFKSRGGLDVVYRQMHTGAYQVSLDAKLVKKAIAILTTDQVLDTLADL